MPLSAVVLAATMMASTVHPSFGMSLSPAAISTPEGHVHATYVVSDTGNTPLKIVIELNELQRIKGHPKAWAVGGDFKQASVSDEAFTLQPHESKKIVVTIRADKFRHDVGVNATASIPTAKANTATVKTSTVARFTVNSEGPAAPTQAPINAEGAPQAHTSVMALALPIGIVTALLAGIAYMTRRIVRRKRHA